MNNETFERASEIKGQIARLQYDLAAIQESQAKVVFFRDGKGQISVDVPEHVRETLHNIILEDYTKRIDELQKEFDEL